MNTFMITAMKIIVIIIINKSNLIRIYEHDGCKIGRGECKMVCVGKPKNKKC